MSWLRRWERLTLKDDVEILLRLGLTPSQGKVYLALVKLGTGSKGSVIAKVADVPRQDVYRTLDELQKIGIVQKTLENPAKFWGSPPKEVVENLLERKMNYFSKLKKDADDFAISVKELFDETVIQQEKNEFVLLTDRDAVTWRVSKIIENTQTTINCISPFRELTAWFAVLSEAYDAALDRGVKIRWITEEPKTINAIPKTLCAFMERKNFEFRSITSYVSKISTYDQKEVVLAIVENGSFACPGLWSNNPCLVSIVQSHFETLWKSASTPIE
jgi:sugar-specific transcriptional regulator TrmB